MTNLKLVKLETDVERITRTTMDTIEITPLMVQGWKNPKFQRPLKVNQKVQAIAEKIKASGVLPGIVTLGVFDKEIYLLDGQHRREAFLLSEIAIGYCDVRIHHFKSLADMGQEFVDLNSRIVNLKPDDILRGLEDSIDSLRILKRALPFVGYDNIRRGDSKYILSMNSLLRAWFASSQPTPRSSTFSAIEMATMLTAENATECVKFYKMVYEAWGPDREYSLLWRSLNLTIVAWFYRRVVLEKDQKTLARMTPEAFAKAMMGLSAKDSYLSWLVGRQLNERDRSPCYMRIKQIVGARIEATTGKKSRLPAPAWAANSGRTVI